MKTDPKPQGEAQLLLDFFDNAETGCFVEVGAANPGQASRTERLEAAGWSGVVVEPRPEVAAFLVTARKARIVAAACVAPDVAGQPLALRVADPISAIAFGWRSTAASSSYVVNVPTRTLDDVLREAEAREPLDLLILDVHGLELDALLGLDFGRWQPRLIVMADPVVDLQRHRFLKECGYRLIHRTGGCGWYVPAGSPARAQRGRWPILRDYYLALPFRMTWHALRRLNARIMAKAD